MKTFFTSILFFMLSLVYSQTTVNWGNVLGGEGSDHPLGIIITKEKGSIVAGYTNTFNHGDVTGSIGKYDCWFVKLDSSGSVIWKKIIGGSYDDYTHDIAKIDEENFIAVGKTYSNNGDVSGLHGPVNTFSDAWIVKIDSSGNILWQKALGGLNEDNANTVAVTADKGFIIAGSSQSKDSDINDTIAHHQSVNGWVTKLDSLGNIEWSKLYGGTSVDHINTITPTIDGGYIFVGTSYSNTGEAVNNHGDADLWIVKIDALGNIEWSKMYGGIGTEKGEDILQNKKGEYVIVGTTSSTTASGDILYNNGEVDVWVIKIDALGDVLMNKSYGGLFKDYGYSIIQTSDEGYLIGGETNSNNNDVNGLHVIPGGFFTDAWVLKIDTLGSVEWSEVYGGKKSETVSTIKQVQDQRYLVACTALSIDGDIVVYDKHGADGEYWWILELEENKIVSVEKMLKEHPFINIYPNPNSGSFTIESSLNYNKIVISNALGEEVLILINRNTPYAIEKLKKGSYFVQLITKNKVITQKIIVSK